jgi:succinate dehydrogenase / fumarate reductase cytochrome b subunit
MSVSIRRPQPYRPSGLRRIIDGLRYGGGPGQWSWLIHRVTGIGILIYLVAHITDTFFVVVNPEWYDHTLQMYGGRVGGGYYWPLRWAFRLGELGLFACVLFHALNGLRIIAFDFWPRAVHYHKELLRVVTIVFLAIMIPAAIWIVIPLASSPKESQPQAPSGPDTTASVKLPLAG